MHYTLWKLLASQYALEAQRMWQSIIREILTGKHHYSVEDLDNLAEKVALQLLAKLPDGEANNLTSDQIHQFIYTLDQVGVPEEARTLLKNT
ncbi:MAG: hypothetical protein HS126_39990 [Anaerolineales bacterium]|nr:hypothetical protein [Anaerolineales bacterium]